MRLQSLSGKLYGRDKELAELNRVYQQVLEEGTSRIILLESYSGNGKTSLVTHFGSSIKNVHEKDNCPQSAQPRFIKGKFDEQNQKPYAAFAQAFRDFVAYLIRHREQEKERIDAIKEAVGSEWEVLQEVIPNLHELLGVQHHQEERGPFASSGKTSVNTKLLKKMNQFQFRFKSFVRAACGKAPVCLFMDDLQWGDMSSLELLKSIVSDGQSRNLFVIGSYRGREIDEHHTLFYTIAHLKNEDYCGAQLTEMGLSDFCRYDLNQFIAATLDLVPEKTVSLSEVIMKKTNGNIFFSKQLLQHLVDERLVRYDMNYYQWTWEVEEIAGATDLSENVVELVASRIRQLPEKVINILKIASCLWYSFEVPVLEFIVANAQDRINQKGASMRLALDESKEFSNELRELDAEHQSAIVQGLRVAAEQGLLDEMGTNGFKFAHDRIREATYSLIEVGQERDSMHLVIGELLWCMFNSERSQQWMLYSSVDQLNQVSNQFHDATVRYELAEINLEAAECAIGVSAFLPAIQYLKSGIQFLGNDPWDQHYKLCLALHSKQASLESSVGHPEDSENVVETILKHARTLDDKLPAYATLVESLGVRGKLVEALGLAHEVLEGLGEPFPKKTTGRLFQRKVRQDTELTRRLLSKHNDASILALPQLGDRRKEYALRIMNLVVDAAFHLGAMQQLFLMINRMVRISLEHGLGDASGVAFALYGFGLNSKNGDRRENYRYGKLALLIQERTAAKEWDCRVLVFVYVLLNHWMEPLQKSLEPLLTAHNAGMERGDVDYAFQAAGAFLTLHWYGGNDLKSGVDDMRKFCAQMREYSQDKALAIYLPLLQCLLNMTGASPDAALLYGEAIDEKDYEEKKSSNSTVQSYQMQLAYYFDDMELAEEMSTKLQAVSKSFNAHYLFVARKFFFGLISLRIAMDETTGEKKRRMNVSLARKVIEEMEQWASHGGLNCLHKLLILKAELKAFTFLHEKGRWFSSKKKESIDVVREAYDTAIATSLRSGFRNDAALACERTSIFLERCQEDAYWVRSYMSRAVDYYRGWGAQAKVDQLRRSQSRRKLVTDSSSSSAFVVGQRCRRSSIDMHAKVQLQASVPATTRAHRFSGGALMQAAATKEGLLGSRTREPNESSANRDETNSTLDASDASWGKSSQGVNDGRRRESLVAP